jgi:hypothetical protein
VIGQSSFHDTGGDEKRRRTYAVFRRDSFIVAFAATAVFWRAVKFNAAFHALFQPQFDAIDNHSSSSRRLEMWRFRKVVSQNL